MVTHAWNLCSAFNPSKCTHTAVRCEQTHTHTWSSGQPFMLRNPGSSWGFNALLKGLTSVVVSRVERALDVHSSHLQSLPARDSNPLPLGYKFDSLSIRPRLPPDRREMGSGKFLEPGFELKTPVAHIAVCWRAAHPAISDDKKDVLERQSLSEVKLGRGSPICERLHKKNCGIL